MKRRSAPHAPERMTRAYNRTIAFSKIDIAPLDKLDARMIESISRSHKVPVEQLQARLEARRQREAAA